MHPLEFRPDDIKLEFHNWKVDHAVWLADLRRCEDQHEEALDLLDKLDDALSEHVSTCKAHDRFIRDHQKLIETHENGLEELKYWAVTDTNRYLTKERQLSEMQERLGEAHSRIRQHHDTVMQEFTRLAESVSSILLPDRPRPERIDLRRNPQPRHNPAQNHRS